MYYFNLAEEMYSSNIVFRDIGANNTENFQKSFTANVSIQYSFVFAVNGPLIEPKNLIKAAKNLVQFCQKNEIAEI